MKVENYKELRTGFIHAPGAGGDDHTLCGVDNTAVGRPIEEDSEIVPVMELTKEKITCPTCIQVITHCLKIGKRGIGEVADENAY